MSLLSGNSNSHHERRLRQIPTEPFRFTFTPIHPRLNLPVSWLSVLGLLGSIGWAVMVPTLLGLASGLWIDTMFPGYLNWVSLMLPLGLFLGCLNAGYWFLQDSTPKD
jgi:predicted F0F1-ATPase subunit